MFINNLSEVVQSRLEMCAGDYRKIIHAHNCCFGKMSIEFLSGYYHTVRTSSIILFIPPPPELFGTELISGDTIDLVSWLEYQLQQFSIPAGMSLLGRGKKKKKEESIQLAGSSILLEKIKS